MPVLSLVIVHDHAGVNDAGHPAQQRQQQAKDETEKAARHEYGDRGKDDAKKVAERFHRNCPMPERSSDRRPKATKDGATA
jgi:hypothetical protein